MKRQAEFINSEKLKSLAHLKKESVELSLTRCGYEECGAGYSSSPHKKSYYVLVTIMDGNCLCEINGQTYELSKDSYVMIYPEWECRFSSQGYDSWSYAWIGFAGIKAEECVIYSGFSMDNPVLKAENVNVRETVDRMLDAHDNTFSDVLKRNGILRLFFSELIEYHNRQFIEEQLKNVEDTAKSPHIRNAITYINDNYASKIKINELADHIGMNRSYLASSFKKATGYSPKEYLLSLRMEKAKSLLEKTDMPINAVANSIGYSDQLAFSRMFKEYSGISPKAFREEIQKQKI